MTRGAVAATLFAAEDLRLIEQPPAALASDMVRVRFGAGGICGSDLHYFRHARTGDFAVTEPLILGHEISGEIVEIAGTAQGLSVGDRVAVNPSRWCGECRYCREGRENLCERIHFMGSASRTPHMQGGFSSFIDVTPAQCVVVPSHVSYTAAALAEPLAVALHAVARVGQMRARTVAVIGAGPIGLLVMLAARLASAESITVVDIAAAPLSFASKLGADRAIDLSGGDEAVEALRQLGPDVVFEVSGTAAGLATAIAVVRRGGTLVQVGNLPGGAIPVPANAVMAKELDVYGTFRFGREFDEAVGLIVSGQVDVTRLVTAELALSEAPQAFKLALDRSQSVKVMLTAG